MVCKSFRKLAKFYNLFVAPIVAFQIIFQLLVQHLQLDCVLSLPIRRQKNRGNINYFLLKFDLSYLFGVNYKIYTNFFDVTAGEKHKRLDDNMKVTEILTS